MAKAPKRSIGEVLQAVPRWMLFVILLATTSVPAFFSLPVPNRTDKAAQDFFSAVTAIPEGSTILLMSDWTNSTRGESGGHFEALMRILMRRNIRIALFSSADPQAPQVARDAIARVNAERRLRNEEVWDRWTHWVNLGYLPNAEAGINAIGNNFRTAFAGRTDFPPGSPPRDVFQSPVLQNIQRVEDFPIMIVITASKTSTITIERLYGKVPLAFMVTGVMGPETNIYYVSGQLSGMAAGLKGVYDMETLMETGFPGQPNAGKGTAYYPTLQFAMGLLIIAVVVGNIGMALARRNTR